MILLIMESTEKSESSSYSLSNWDRHTYSLSQVLFSLLKHYMYLDLYITDTFCKSICHGAKKLFPRAVGYGHLRCYFLSELTVLS